MSKESSLQLNDLIAKSSTIQDPRKTLLSGDEWFTFAGKSLSHSVKDYWAWSFSDLYNNIYRGILSEYIVATALGIAPPDGNYLREVWNPYDLLSKSGIRVEVKSAAYLQSFNYGREKQKLSKIIFGIAPALIYDNSMHKYGSEAKHNNDVYVFCHNTSESFSISPLNLDYWDFYVLPTTVLNDKKPNQRSISLQSLLKLAPECVKYDGLADAVERAVK